MAGLLRDAGLEVWAEAPDAADREALLSRVRAATCCVVGIGHGGLRDWDSGLLGLALRRALVAPTFRLIPVLLPGAAEPFDAAQLPHPLDTLPWVDLRTGYANAHNVQRLVAAIRDALPLPPVPPAGPAPVCPYRGLQPFEQDHAEFFFGRGADVQRLLEHIKGSRLLAVVAPSGSGKSSLVRAGLFPALRQGALPGGESWRALVLTPGQAPLSALAAQLQDVTQSAAPQRTLARLRTDSRTLHTAVAQALADGPCDVRLVWVIDQFEEIFTQCPDEVQRAQFVANLLYAATVPGGRNIVVFTLRADFYTRARRTPGSPPASARIITCSGHSTSMDCVRRSSDRRSESASPLSRAWSTPSLPTWLASRVRCRCSSTR